MSETMELTKIKDFNAVCRSAKDASIQGLRFGSLDESSLVLKMYAGGAFAVSENLSSQFGYLVLLCDNTSRSHILDYSNKKSKRIVRSIMSAETMAFADGYDKTLIICKAFESIMGFKVSCMLFQRIKAVVSCRFKA